MFKRVYVHVRILDINDRIINPSNFAHLIDNQDDSMLLMSMMNIVSAECALFKRVCAHVHILDILLIR